MTITWNGTPLAVAPALEPVRLATQAIEAKIPSLADVRPGDSLPFAIELTLKGTQQMFFQPSGSTTTVRLSSTWPDPSFAGAFLPDTARVSEEGFDADWKLSHFGHGYPKSWRDDEVRVEKILETAQAARFGVTLATPVDPLSAGGAPRSTGRCSRVNWYEVGRDTRPAGV